MTQRKHVTIVKLEKMDIIIDEVEGVPHITANYKNGDGIMIVLPVRLDYINTDLDGYADIAAFVRKAG